MQLSADDISDLMKNVCDWQLANLPEYRKRSDGRWTRILGNGWLRSVFYAGVLALWCATGDETYLHATHHWAKENAWRPGPRPRHADDHCACQVYLDLYAVDRHACMINPTLETFDGMMADPRPGRTDWWWCDALFMAPPVLARLALLTNDERYLDYLHAMWWDTTEHLYDSAEHLFYRDAKYRPRGNGFPRTRNGQKIFWSRANGWVMAGIARVLHSLPIRHPYRRRYAQLLGEMAETVASLQSPNGFWPSSLLDAAEYPEPETSGTALFCFALAWGVNHTILSSETYLPIIRKAWTALAGAVEADGRLAWVQPTGEAPASAKREDTHEYGVGAFLLAGSEVVKL